MKIRRLQTRTQFEALLATSAAARSEHFVMHRMALDANGTGQTSAEHQPLFGAAPLWVGAMVPKRWARRAVTRNLIKRQVYALSEQALGGMSSAAFLVRLRSGYSSTQFPSAASLPLRTAVRQELLRLFQDVQRRYGAAA